MYGTIYARTDTTTKLSKISFYLNFNDVDLMISIDFLLRFHIHTNRFNKQDQHLQMKTDLEKNIKLNFYYT